eukprot:sb/3470145/
MFQSSTTKATVNPFKSKSQNLFDLKTRSKSEADRSLYDQLSKPSFQKTKSLDLGYVLPTEVTTKSKVKSGSSLSRQPDGMMAVVYYLNITGPLLPSSLQQINTLLSTTQESFTGKLSAVHSTGVFNTPTTTTTSGENGDTATSGGDTAGDGGDIGSGTVTGDKVVSLADTFSKKHLSIFYTPATTVMILLLISINRDFQSIIYRGGNNKKS